MHYEVTWKMSKESLKVVSRRTTKTYDEIF